AWIEVDRKELLADQVVERRRKRHLVAAAERRKTLYAKGLPEDSRVLDQLALGRLETVESRRDEGVQRLGHVDLPDWADDLQPVPVAGEGAPVEQQAPRPDR